MEVAMKKITTLTIIIAAFSALIFSSANAENISASEAKYDQAHIEKCMTPKVLGALQYLLQEEKLMRDVFENLFERYDINAFKKAADTADDHFKKLMKLLADHGVHIDILDTPGIYTSAIFEKLYTDAVEAGSKSLNEVLRVGRELESINILDLKHRDVYKAEKCVRDVLDSFIADADRRFKSFAMWEINHR